MSGGPWNLPAARRLLAAGRKDEASAAMKLLAEANPRDGRIQEAWALALFEANDPGALAAWENVERKSALW